MAPVTAPPDGVYVPVPTFFAPVASLSPYSQSLDLTSQSEHSLFLAESGITGLIISGSTGEAVHLTAAERFELISSTKKTLVENGFDKMVIMAGTATQNIDETVRSIQESKDAGAEYALVLTPSYFAAAGGYSDEGMGLWYTSVADQSPLPVLVYNYPAVTNNLSLSLSLLKHLSQHPNIVGCKLSHGNMSHHLILSSSPAIKHEKFRVYTGLGQQLLPLLLSGPGAAGAIDGTAAYFPKTMVRIWTISRKIAAAEGNTTKDEWDEVHRLQCAYSEVEEWVVKFGTVGIKLAIKKILGMGQDGGRLPFVGMDVDAEWEKFRGAFEVLQDLEGGLS
ncbi:hypothetical protein ABW19_dt0205619 [Dactylella cylindrospora]|nr:hypothetical protein ABW19_dt0205619 [Dactylella cylindrospora]